MKHKSHKLEVSKNPSLFSDEAGGGRIHCQLLSVPLGKRLPPKFIFQCPQECPSSHQDCRLPRDSSSFIAIPR